MKYIMTETWSEFRGVKPRRLYLSFLRLLGGDEMGAQARPFGSIRVGRAEELDASRSHQALSNAKLKMETLNSSRSKHL